ncbi:MAG: helix-turn-helix domain-containing protein [Nitrospiraceae bacterium]|uniref:XRE family transcriptional regulator n=1 Tax=Nitrospira cf. moscoviensis SBR1015 TaxID=96242 RepID=UPI000A0CE171|nr:XRE family transcriptional regulator [Nitrospira cf. moscoviensis SBR1015]MBY0246794.1 helix-turn-helix domain-containing protein [Nitrospiraceae bacterium]OQW30444.1 MAG: hypothetical protein A4E20_16690 [Nitrospira sp. SG-bin2]
MPSTHTPTTVRTAQDLGHALGLSAADTAEMEFRSVLTVALAKIIQAGRLTHAEIAKQAGTSRTRVTAIANGNTHGVSTDVLIRVLAQQAIVLKSGSRKLRLDRSQALHIPSEHHVASGKSATPPIGDKATRNTLRYRMARHHIQWRISIPTPSVWLS